jgi:hypothetical protein
MTRAARTRHAPGPRIRRLARHLVTGLAAEFLLGMAVNLLGLPSQATGAARTASTAFLAAHALIAAGLAIAAGLGIRHAQSTRDRVLAAGGAAAIAVTITAGILTLITKSNWWSYGMAAGFITSLLIYAGILRPPEHRQPTTSD